jgi:hypothetical protein
MSYENDRRSSVGIEGPVVDPAIYHRQPIRVGPVCVSNAQFRTTFSDGRILAWDTSSLGGRLSTLLLARE